MTPAPTSLLKRVPVRAVLASCAVLGLGTICTFAAFTDDGAVTAEFSTGNVDIAFDGKQQGNPVPYVSDLKMTNAQIGTVVYEPLIVNNRGSLDFSYTVTPTVLLSGTSNTLGLADALTIAVVKVATPAACDDAGTGFDAAAAVAQPVTEPVSAVSDVVLPVSPVLRSLETASPAPERDVFCFRVALPGATGGTTEQNNAADSLLMDQTVGVQFNFVATQLTT